MDEMMTPPPSPTTEVIVIQCESPTAEETPVVEAVPTHEHEIVPIAEADIWRIDIPEQADIQSKPEVKDEVSQSWGSRLDKQASWLESHKGVVLLVATLLASLAYSGGLNPPGGVWDHEHHDKNGVQVEGLSVMAVNNPTGYNIFCITNMVALVASFSVVMLLVSGLPMDRSIHMCVLTTMLGIAIIATLLNHAFAVTALRPINYEKSTDPVPYLLLYGNLTWCAIVAMIIIAHITRLVMKTVKRRKTRVL